MNDLQHLQVKLHDSTFRDELKKLNKKCLAELGCDIDSGIEYRIIENTKETTYIIMPSQSTQSFDMNLEQIQAAGSASSGSTLGSFGTLCGTVSTGATAGTAACAS